MSKSKALTRINKELIRIDADLPLDFQDKINEGKADERPDATYLNTMIAIERLGLDCRFNIFTTEYQIAGHLLSVNEIGEMRDAALRGLRELIRRNFRFEPNERNMAAAAMRMCERRAYHPIKNYLDPLVWQWDGVERIDGMFVNYFGAADTPFNRAVARLVMIASVRRIYQPGCKFDYVVCLQSPQGYNKSEALQILYGDDYCTDESIFGMRTQQVEETVRGMWAVECAEMVGYSDVKMERIKAQISRKRDRVRRSFDRLAVNAKRSCVLWSTVNDEEFFRPGGEKERRFFPITVGRIDLEALRRDRDQLWAEAMSIEELNPPRDLSLAEEFWGDAEVERKSRTQSDPWHDLLMYAAGKAASAESHRKHAADAQKKAYAPIYYDDDCASADGQPEERIASAYLIGDVINIPPAQRNAAHGKRIGEIMRDLKWRGPIKVRIGGVPMAGYARDLSDSDREVFKPDTLDSEFVEAAE